MFGFFLRKVKVVKLDMKRSSLIVWFLALSAIVFGYTKDQIVSTRIVSDKKIEWKQFGPGNAGFVNFLRFHPTIPGICLTSPDMGNTYQTDNNGAKWYTIKDVDGPGNDVDRLNDAYYSVNNASFGLLIESSRLWITSDTGKNWRTVLNCPWYDPVSTNDDGKAWYTKVSALAIDPANDNTWYVGGGAHPRGQSHLSWNSFTACNAATPRGRTKYNGDTHKGKIFRTTDGGKSWTTLSSGIDPEAQFCRIIVDPANSNLIFAASSYGLFKSENKGATWTNIGSGSLPNNTIMDMDYYYDKITGKLILYVADQVRYEPSGTTTTNTGGIYKSEDRGATWVGINSNLYLNINQLTGGVPTNYYKYIAKWFGITLTEAKAKYPVLPANMLQYFNSLNVDPTDSNTLYVGFYDAQTQYSILPGRLWQTTNRGNSWINVARDFGPAWAKDKAFWMARNNPYNDNMVEGHDISNQQFNQDYPLRSLRYCAVSPNGDVMLLYAHNTFLSTDKGVTWNQVDEHYTAKHNIVGNGNSNLPGACIFQDRRLGNGITYFGTGEHGLWRTTTDGGNGEQAVEFFPNACQTVFAGTTHPWNLNEVYTTSMRQANLDKIMRSTDGAKTWVAWGKATDAEEYMRTRNLRIDPVNPNNLYFGVNIRTGVDLTKQAGIFASNDGGKTFTRKNTGLPNFAQTADLEFDPRDKAFASLFAAVQYNSDNGGIKGGLFFTSNRGESWSEVVIDSKVMGVNNITFDHTGRMYVTTGRNLNDKSASYDEGGLWYSDDFGTTWTCVFHTPFALLVDVSPFDYNLIVCTAEAGGMNPGVYISEDRGATWSKNNRMIGENGDITDVQFDIFDASLIHLTQRGSGFYKGSFPNGAASRRITVTPGAAEIDINEVITVSAEVSAGIDKATLRFKSANTDIAEVDDMGVVAGKKQGAVRIWVTSADGRYSDFVQLNVSSKISTSVQPKAANAIVLYPNPATHTLSILGVENSVQYKIYTLVGTEMASGSGPKINISALPSGEYIVKLLTTHSVVIKQFAKK